MEQTCVLCVHDNADPMARPAIAPPWQASSLHIFGASIYIPNSRGIRFSFLFLNAGVVRSHFYLEFEQIFSRAAASAEQHSVTLGWQCTSAALGMARAP